MKTIQSIIIVTLALFINFGDCDIPGTLVGFSRLATRAVPSCLNSILPVCGDCKTLWKCQNTDTPPPPTVVCKTAYPDRPFCSNGACTKDASTDCIPAFRCFDAGYYPDPLNCSRYHLCGAAGAVSSAHALYECPPGFVYNPLTTMCKLSTDCAVIDCTPDPYGYVAYPADPSFFASCTPGEDPIMMKCPQYFWYRPTEFKCVFQCPREGRIAHPSDKVSYYECYWNGSTYLYRSLKCVDNYEFNPDTQQCLQKPVPQPPTTAP